MISNHKFFIKLRLTRDKKKTSTEKQLIESKHNDNT